MNKQEILALKCKQIAGHNIKAYRIMMELHDAGRDDLLDEIIKALNVNSSILTPEQIVKTYDSCGGKDGFIARCNKIWNKKTIARERKEADYEYHLKQYACGERADHPDGTKFEDGKEINYD